MDEKDKQNNPVIQPEAPQVGSAKGGGLSDRSRMILIVVVILLLIGGLIFAIVSSSDDDTSNQVDQEFSFTPEEPPVSEVIISKDAFVPSTTTVTLGSQVKFTNKDATAHEVVQSPADEVQLEEFEIDEKLTKDSSYAYVFEQTGTFHIQDKDDPTKWNVTVIVE